MGATASRQQPYGFNYGSPPPGYAGYGQYGTGGMYPPGISPYATTRRKGMNPGYYGPGMPGMGYPGGVMPMMSYPGMFPQAIAQPQYVYPMMSQPVPMQQVSGQPILQQQAAAAQMPQPQVNPQMQPQPIPGPGVLPGPAPMTMPEPQVAGVGIVPTPALGGPAPAMSMPGPSMSGFGGLQGPPGMPEPVIPIAASPAELMAGPSMPMVGSILPSGMPTPRASMEMGGAPPPVQMPEPMSSPPDPDFPSTTTASDPLERNPLPEPPREVDIPPHLIRDTAVTQHGVRLPHPFAGGGSDPLPPLSNPLPELPEDVYESRKYRALTMGNASRYTDPRKVYPEGWFDRARDGERSLGRSLTGTFTRLNPFRSHHGRPGMHRRFNTMPIPFAGAGPAMGPEPQITSESETESDEGPSGPGGLGRAFYRRMPFRFGRQQNRMEGPPVGFMPTPGGPQPMHPFSPTDRRGTPPPPIRFSRDHPQFSGFSHLSPHRVLYKNKLYPTALHLLEAHKFLGTHNEMAERIRTTESFGELYDLVDELRRFVRRDWEDVVINKMEDVLYLKFVQHSDLRYLLLNTDVAELIFAEGDAFWGEGSNGEGFNHLGKALMRLRERLRREAAGR